VREKRSPTALRFATGFATEFATGLPLSLPLVCHWTFLELCESCQQRRAAWPIPWLIGDPQKLLGPLLTFHTTNAIFRRLQGGTPSRRSLATWSGWKTSPTKTTTMADDDEGRRRRWPTPTTTRTTTTTTPTPTTTTAPVTSMTAPNDSEEKKQ